MSMYFFSSLLHKCAYGTHVFTSCFFCLMMYLKYHSVLVYTAAAAAKSLVGLCAAPQTAAHQAPPSLGFSRQEHWSGLPFPSPMHERESESEVTQSYLTCSDPMDCSPPGSSVHGIFQARGLKWVAIAFSECIKSFFPFSKNNFIYLFIGCVESSLLHELFSSYGKQGLLSSCDVRASHCTGFSCCRPQALGHSGSSRWGARA